MKTKIYREIVEMVEILCNINILRVLILSTEIFFVLPKNFNQ